METIMKNNHYTVQVDQRKNRLYLVGKGFWKDIEIAQQFSEHVKQGLQKLSPGYTVLADLREFKTPPIKVGNIIIEGQKMATANTFGKNAMVLGENAAIALPMGRYATASGLQSQTKTFTTHKEAEIWLDAT